MSLAESYGVKEFIPPRKFSDRVLALLDHIDVRIADSSDEREAVARLRYEAYRREGSITHNSARLFQDHYDEKGNVRIFGLYIDGELASSIRIHVADQANPTSPSLSVFRDVLEPELEAGKTIIDPTRFVTDSQFSRQYPGLPHVTVRLCWLAAEYYCAEHFLAAVRVEHQAFYRRIFEQRPICGPRTYPMLKMPISLMTVKYDEVADRVHRKNPYFRSTYFERRMLFGERPHQFRSAPAYSVGVMEHSVGSIEQAVTVPMSGLPS